MHKEDRGITQCYLSPDTCEQASPESQPERLVLDLPTPDGWKAELTHVVTIGYIQRRSTFQQTVTHPKLTRQRTATAVELATC